MNKMKRLLSFVLVLMATTGAWAEDNGTLKYTVSGDEVTITGFADGFTPTENYDLVIPDEIEGKKVVAVGSLAFRGDSGNKGAKIKTVTIGKNVRTIVEKAFMFCPMTTVTIPEDGALTTIEGYAFSDCVNLEQMSKVKALTKIGEQAFESCKFSEAPIHEDGRLTEIGSWAFVHCKNITSVVLPSTFASTYQGIFGSCTSLTSVTFKGNVPTFKNTGYSLFDQCNNLKTINVPLEYLDDYAGSSDFLHGMSASKIKSSYTLPTAGVGTFSTGVAVTLEEGLEAYYCKEYDAAKGTISVVKIDGAVPASTGVLLRKEGAGGQSFTIAASATEGSAVSDNALVAVVDGATIEQTATVGGEGYTNFGLSGGTFKKVNSAGGTLKANRAYLHIKTSELESVAAAAALAIDWENDDNGTTGIREISEISDPSPSPAWEGSGCTVYDLQGCRVSESGIGNSELRKGLYIVNGKKVVIK